ncbi:unnamed protein product [Bursaphelenchus okinawaensis]|uniref:Uncharacterized protein n=1 Tax=Bursaphelenchus okinawaensis TaxID=465554 RepID=A0A811LKE4_9BILA|nr:unnamed protein product [Bursaphelenchus okinawaensis]CAG9124139.1 unnamed protein product [Bursaphelenchus okinawaensis]
MIRGHTQPPGQGYRDCFQERHLCLNIHSSSLGRKGPFSKPATSSMARVAVSTENGRTNLKITIKTSIHQPEEHEQATAILWNGLMVFYENLKEKIPEVPGKIDPIAFYLVPMETARRNYIDMDRTISHRQLVRMFEDAPKSKRISLSKENQAMRAVWIMRGLLNIYQNLPKIDLSFVNGSPEDFDYYVRLLRLLQADYNIPVDNVMVIRDLTVKNNALRESPEALRKFLEETRLKKKSSRRKRSCSTISS